MKKIYLAMAIDSNGAVPMKCSSSRTGLIEWLSNEGLIITRGEDVAKALAKQASSRGFITVFPGTHKFHVEYRAESVSLYEVEEV